jgi:hypothetical protein
MGFEKWTGLIWLTIGVTAGCCENGTEPSGSTTGDEFVQYMSDYQLPK